MTKTVPNWSSVLSENELLRHGIELLIKIKELDPQCEAYIVGGVVRDLILGIPIHDVDIATNVPVSKIAEHFNATDIGKSKDFGIVLVVYKGKPYEIANFREEGAYSDNRHPDDVVIADSFKKDAARRDITINALGADENGNIVDYQGGLEDIRDEAIRTVGDPVSRFEEDALRILRVARFSAKLGFWVADATKRAMIDLVPLIDNLSIERVKDELFKAAITGSSLADYILILDEIGYLEKMLPEIHIMKECEHTPQTHPEGGVFEHTIAALRVSQSTDPVTNVAILFHDVGKPPAKSFGVRGYVRYTGHESIGVPVFNKIAARLKFSNNEKAAISFAIKNHMKGFRRGLLKKSKILDLRHNQYWDVLKETLRSDDASRGAPIYDAEQFEASMAKVEKLYEDVGAQKEFDNRVKALIDGHLIMETLRANNIEFRPYVIGAIKTEIRNNIIDYDFEISREEIVELIIDLGKELLYGESTT
jgi:tRNA nucleotidyltransferase/poly(A) polymerase